MIFITCWHHYLRGTSCHSLLNDPWCIRLLTDANCTHTSCTITFVAQGGVIRFVLLHNLILHGTELDDMHCAGAFQEMCVKYANMQIKEANRSVVMVDPFDEHCLRNRVPHGLELQAAQLR